MKKILLLVLLSCSLSVVQDLSAKQDKILKIDFKTAITEQENNQFSLFSLSSLTQGSMPLLKMVQAIDYAAADPSVSSIYMRPDNISAGLSQMEEVRAALDRFRKSGKRIIAYCENLNNASYYIASVADQVILNPASESYLTGLASQQIFLKDALDALGIEVQLIRHGKYKSAGEMYIRNDISPENLEQTTAMVTSIWDDMCDDIASSRTFSAAEFKGWVNDLSLTDAESFLDKGLVDNLWQKDQLDKYFCENAGVPFVKLVRFVSFNRYADKVQKSLRKKNRRAKSKIAVIYANGEIVTSSEGSTSISSDLIVGKNLASVIARVREDDKVKAVVFRVNSPGGSVMASELIKREMDLLQEKVPVTVSYGDYAASGGYWISAEAGHIFTNKTTLTGSIGCFSMIPAMGDAIRDKLKVNITTVGSSEHSDMMTGLRRLDDAETDYFQAQVEDIYDRFTTIVSRGRGISKAYVDSIAQGRVWTGSDAIGIKLTDEIGGLTDAIAYAASDAGIDRYSIVEYPETVPFSFLSLFSKTEVEDESVTSDEETAISAMLQQAFPFTAAFRRSQRPVMMARMMSAYSFE